MSTTKLKEGIVGVDGASNQAVIQLFPEHRQAQIEFPEAWFCTSRQDVPIDHPHLLAKCGW